MSRSHWWSKFAVLAASTAIIVSACTGTTPTLAPSAGVTPTAAVSAAAYAAEAYPPTAVDCANPPAGPAASSGKTSPYTGTVSQIKALDRLTVEFDLCSADVAFLAKVAFTSNTIQDSDWLKAHAPDKSYVQTTNGTGPYRVKEWVTGDHITLEANPNYWNAATGPKAKTVVIKWSAEATQRLQELQSGQADGIDNVGTDDFATVKADSTLALYPREALNILYMGMNVNDAPWDNEQVRQAVGLGIDRARIAKNFYPAGSEAAKYFTPCAIPIACGGDEWPAFDATKAKQMLTAANFDFSKTYDFHYRAKVRSYLPSPDQVATDLQSQFKDNLGINIKLVVEANATFITDEAAGKFPLFLLGWGADYPDVTDFLDVHFGTGSNKGFGKQFADITAALTDGAQQSDVAKRTTDYSTANTLIKQHVPMVPLVHGGSATAWKADITGAHSSPIGNEALWTMTPGTRDQLVWVQNSEPSGLYCGDESDGDALRICQQIFDSLYEYKVGGLDVEPALATSCDSSADLKTWTCHLRDGVKFGVSGELDANDVVDSYAVQWDAKNPLHIGNAGTWDYFPALFGGLLNPPPPTP
ncbi:MAG TPA: ABC transporter substrate-binding protein [Candidatus Limnocylindrales bacterium]|nr:ABC transporter substrate-binding protein [Candidatus Limnocylindrales bacterium]